MIYHKMLLLAVFFVLLPSCLLYASILLQMAHISLFNISSDGSLAILRVRLLANAPSSDIALLKSVLFCMIKENTHYSH